MFHYQRKIHLKIVGIVSFDSFFNKININYSSVYLTSVLYFWRQIYNYVSPFFASGLLKEIGSNFTPTFAYKNDHNSMKNAPM